MKQRILVCISLTAMIVAVFGQTIHFDFVNYDDDAYVYENPIIAGGLHWHAIVWVFTHSLCSNWHPLTWVSHMLDCQVYGLHPGGHHVTSVLVHITSVMVLFCLLQKWTGKLWSSALVAAIFAIHPLRVESVAWVAERKDVLSGLFFMLTLWAYSYYAQPSDTNAHMAAKNSSNPRFWYALALALYALGLMCKPMLVTLPFVLLLWDFWPLRRLTSFRPSTSPASVWLDKLPFLALAAASCVITILAQERVAAAVQDLPISWRMENAFVAYAEYLWQLFYPVGLAVFYPLPETRPPLWLVSGSVLILMVISLVSIFNWRKRPWLLTGWLWFIGMLVPVIGLVQVGAQERADRYTYLPQIGLSMLVVWGAVELTNSWRHQRVLLGSLAVILLAGMLTGARAQAGFWKNSSTLWTHTLSCTSGNWVAHENLGNVLFKQKQFAEAIEHYQQTCQLKPKDAQAQYDLGAALATLGQVDEAVAHYQLALQINPDYVDAHVNLGTILAKQGMLDDAVAHYEHALQIKPDHAKAQVNLANVLSAQGKWTDAVEHYRRAIQIKPDYTLAYLNLANALGTHGKLNEAVQYLQQAEALASAQGNSGLAQAIHKQLGSLPKVPAPPSTP